MNDFDLIVLLKDDNRPGCPLDHFLIVLNDDSIIVQTKIIYQAFDCLTI